MKSAVIVVFTHKPTLEWFERISLDRCREVFSGKYDVVLACPEALDVKAYLEIFPGLQIRYFPHENFQTIQAYNRLKYTLDFYDALSSYRFLLTYELDSFVFEDQLHHWCDAGWDFIGAPIFQGFYDAEPSAPVLCVGNSGFSLRNIRKCREVLSSQRRIESPFSAVNSWLAGDLSRSLAVRRFLKLWLRPVRFSNACQHLLINEDLFWGQKVPRQFPDYRIADPSSASRFSFDGSPSRLYRESNSQLPFGCHKWMDVEPEFWRPIIENHGYNWGAGAHS